MEKYKSKKELNLFKLWGIKKIKNMQAPTNNRIFDKIVLKPNQGSFQESSEDDDEGGLPESGEEEDAGQKHSYSRHQGRANLSTKSPPFNKDTHLPPP